MNEWTNEWMNEWMNEKSMDEWNINEWMLEFSLMNSFFLNKEIHEFTEKRSPNGQGPGPVRIIRAPSTQAGARSWGCCKSWDKNKLSTATSGMNLGGWHMMAPWKKAIVCHHEIPWNMVKTPGLTIKSGLNGLLTDVNGIYINKLENESPKRGKLNNQSRNFTQNLLIKKRCWTHKNCQLINKTWISSRMRFN